jgi:DNA-binding MurR/RpiR family transcriptional regulator
MILSLDLKALEQAVEILDHAQRIFVSGDITSYSVAHFAALAINRARGNVYLVRADGEGASRLIEIGPDDAVLAFTFPPYSRNVLRVVEWARERGAATIGVTDHAVSPVGRIVSLVLPAVASGLGPQNTLVPAVAIANALINALALRGDDRAMGRYKAVNHLLGKWDLYLLGSDDDE